MYVHTCIWASAHRHTENTHTCTNTDTQTHTHRHKDTHTTIHAYIPICSIVLKMFQFIRIQNHVFDVLCFIKHEGITEKIVTQVPCLIKIIYNKCLQSNSKKANS